MREYNPALAESGPSPAGVWPESFRNGGRGGVDKDGEWITLRRSSFASFGLKQARCLLFDK
jgi:hypothetical protein